MPHHEGCGDARPEQALRQRKDQNDDRAGARPDADRDNRRKPALPAARTRQFLRLGAMGVAPGRGVLVATVVMVVVVMAVIVTVRMIMVVVVVRVIMIMVMMIVTVVVLVIVTASPRPRPAATAGSGRARR